MLITFLSCDTINDPKYYLSSDNLVGQWLRIKEIPSTIPGYYTKDTTTYRIGKDPLVTSDTVYYLKSPMTYKVIYTRGGYTLGYISNPVESYDYNLSVSTLVYDYIPDALSGAKSQITFQMPVNDSLCIIVGSPSSPSETFGLKREMY